jgi:hypothetical protein
LCHSTPMHTIIPLWWNWYNTVKLVCVQSGIIFVYWAIGQCLLWLLRRKQEKWHISNFGFSDCGHLTYFSNLRETFRDLNNLEVEVLVSFPWFSNFLSMPHLMFTVLVISTNYLIFLLGFLKSSSMFSFNSFVCKTQRNH